MYMENCIFCKIVKGEIKSEIVYQDDDCLAILDAHPNSKGHTLVISKAHHENFLETPDDLKEKLIRVVSKTSDILKTTYQPSGMNITTNIGQSAGQVIFHTHIHIIPRY